MKKNNLLTKSMSKNIIHGFKFNNKNESIIKMEQTPYYNVRKIILDIINNIIIKKTAKSIKNDLKNDVSLFLNKFSKGILNLNNIKFPKRKNIKENCFKIEKEPNIHKMDNWNRGQINKFSFKITKKKNLNEKNNLKSFSFKRNSIKSLSRNYISNSNNSFLKKNFRKKKNEKPLLVDFSKINVKNLNKYEQELREGKLGTKKLNIKFKKGVK